MGNYDSETNLNNECGGPVLDRVHVEFPILNDVLLCYNTFKLPNHLFSLIYFLYGCRQYTCSELHTIVM